MSTIKVDTLATRTGSGNITVSNNVAASGTLAVTGNATANSINLGGRSLGAGGSPVGINFSSASTSGMQINDTNSGNLGGMLGFYSGSGTGTLRGNIQNANNAGVHMCVGTSGSVVFTQSGYVAANALDDYEEGSWTPAFGGSGSDGSMSYHANTSGSYVKVGKLVMYNGVIQTSSGVTGGSGTLQIKGLPFTAGTSVNNWYGSASIGYLFSLSAYGTSTNDIKLLGPSVGNTFIRFHSFTNVGDSSAPPTQAQVQGGTAVYFGGHYETA